MEKKEVLDAINETKTTLIGMGDRELCFVDELLKKLGFKE